MAVAGNTLRIKGSMSAKLGTKTKISFGRRGCSCGLANQPINCSLELQADVKSNDKHESESSHRLEQAHIA